MPKIQKTFFIIKMLFTPKSIKKPDPMCLKKKLIKKHRTMKKVDKCWRFVFETNWIMSSALEPKTDPLIPICKAYPLCGQQCDRSITKLTTIALALRNPPLENAQQYIMRDAQMQSYGLFVNFGSDSISQDVEWIALLRNALYLILWMRRNYIKENLGWISS